MFHVVVSFIVPPERQDEFVAAALEDGRNSIADEPGTLQFDVVRDPENADTFYLVEAYADEAAFDAHVKGQHLATFVELIEPYADGPTWLVRGAAVSS